MIKARGIVLGAAAVAMSLSAACGTAVSTSGSGGQGGSPIICPQEATPCCAPDNPDPCCTPCATTTSTTASTTASTTTSTSAGTGGGVPATCGGKTGKTCAADEFCNYPDNSCSVFDSTGVCEKRPVSCPDNYQPTCGCDGMVYSNTCDANAAGSDENDNGGCAPPAGTFGCGSHFCAADTEYCEVALSDVSGYPNTYSCKAIPVGCGAPACGCLANVPCGATCAPTPDGGLVVTCAGG